MRHIVRKLKLNLAVLITTSLLLGGCSTINYNQIAVPDYAASWGIAPFLNQSGAPYAGLRAAAITAGLLRSRGIDHILTYQRKKKDINGIVPFPYNPTPTRKLLAWAHRHHLAYLMLGSVNEWRYKIGLDGVPAVSMTLQLIDVSSGQIIWNAVGSKTGASRSGLGFVAQKLINRMLAKLQLEVPYHAAKAAAKAQEAQAKAISTRVAHAKMARKTKAMKVAAKSKATHIAAKTKGKKVAIKSNAAKIAAKAKTDPGFII